MSLPSPTVLKDYLVPVLLGLSVVVSLYLHADKLQLDVQGYHTWRQSWTMLNVRNFARVDANILNPRIAGLREGEPKIHRLEFPVSQWIIGMAYRLFGEHIIIARLFIFLVGIIAILGMYHLLRALSLAKLPAAAGTILMQYSTVFYFYTINPLPDFLALTAGLWYLVFTFRYFSQQSLRHLLLAGSCLCLATLAKLPFIILSVVAVIYFPIRLFTNGIGKKTTWRFAWLQAVLLIPALAWYSWVIPDWEIANVTKGIFDSSVTPAKFNHIFRYHFNFAFPKLFFNEVTLVLATLGLTVFIYGRWRRSSLVWYIWPLFGISLLFFSFEFYAIDAIHDYYMLPFLPWMYALVGCGLQFVRDRFGPWSWLVLIPLIVTAIQLSYTTSLDRWDVKWSYCNEDLLLHREALREAVPAREEVIMLNAPSLAIFPYAIGKNGHIFWNNAPRPLWLEDLIGNEGVKYMYCDSREFDEREDIRVFIDSTILRAGSVYVHRLRLPQ